MASAVYVIVIYVRDKYDHRDTGFIVLKNYELCAKMRLDQTYEIWSK